MNRAFIFPGQGSQVINMGKDFFDTFKVAKEVFQEVDNALNTKLTDIIFNGTDEELTLTKNTQPALMTVSIAILRTILYENNIKLSKACSYVAGHSLGEYSALCGAESLSLSDTAMLLQVRGSAMQNAGSGSMAACFGITYQALNEIIKNSIQDGICQIANDNIDGQIVISGHDYNIERIIAVLKDIGYRCIKLKVSAPFHSELMKSAEEPMIDALNNVSIRDPLVPLIANVTAKVVTSYQDIKTNLIKQICGRVRWRETMDELAALKVTEIVEIGAGSVLANLAKKTNHNFNVVSISNIEEMDNFLKKL